jgi:hypothetical protein
VTHLEKQDIFHSAQNAALAAIKVSDRNPKGLSREGIRDTIKHSLELATGEMEKSNLPAASEEMLGIAALALMFTSMKEKKTEDGT